MTTKPTIKLGLSNMSNSVLQAFTQRCINMITANANYSTPSPTLIAMATLLTAFSDALTAWGTSPGSKGSTLAKSNLDDARNALEVGLTTLAYYCLNTTPYDSGALISAGWELKAASNPVGMLGPVRDIISLKNEDIGAGEVWLDWKKPLGVSAGAAKSYMVFRSTTSSFASASWVTGVTRSRFKDTGLAAGVYYYWIVPLGSAGMGAVSDVCVATSALVP